MATEDAYIPFSQRTGLEPTPPQLRLGQVSSDLRRSLGYYIALEIERETRFGVNSAYFDEKWKRVSKDLHVLFLKQDVTTFDSNPRHWEKGLNEFVTQAPIGRLFDFIEFLVRHANCSKELKQDLAEAFVTARAAYRIVDRQIVAIGTEEQGTAFQKAVSDAEAIGAGAARKHLVEAGLSLRNANWAGSIRESIHAVEATALQLAPDAKNDLGKALAKLEANKRLHGGLKAAFAALYGYTSDEKGVRHSLVFKDEAQVDETDALFMLGACASFVSYLLARSS